jgi:hypothetical protein
MTMQNDPRRIDMPFEETTEKRDADEFLQDWMQDSLSCFEQEVADRCSEFQLHPAEMAPLLGPRGFRSEQARQLLVHATCVLTGETRAAGSLRN